MLRSEEVFVDVVELSRIKVPAAERLGALFAAELQLVVVQLNVNRGKHVINKAIGIKNTHLKQVFLYL